MQQRVWVSVTVAAVAVCVVPLLSGCLVTQSKYNSMLQQQQAIGVRCAPRSPPTRSRLYSSRTAFVSPCPMSSCTVLVPWSFIRAVALRSTRSAASSPSMASQGNQIDVVGNTDNVPIGPELAGRYPTNWELAGARAAIVVRYLQDAGVSPAQLAAVSNGQYHPVASNDTAAGRAQNRRTDLLIRPTGTGASSD